MKFRFKKKHRDAMIKAADFIEKNPERHSFFGGRLSEFLDGERGCAAVVIGSFLKDSPDGYDAIIADLGFTDAWFFHESVYQKDHAPKEVAANLRKLAQEKI